MKLFISTFGAFDIKDNDNSLLKDSGRSYKLYKLLQYFITFRNKKILADTIIDNLWPDHESYDPNNMLRAQIYRLRQFIKTIIPEGEDENLYIKINFNNGYYSLDTGERILIDAQEFEELIDLGDSNLDIDINDSISYYEKALSIYKGTYLEDNSYELWLVPIKNYYNKLYIKTLFKLIEILKAKNKHNKIVEICQNAIIYEANNEGIHIYLMESMLKLGQVKDAMSHYEYTTFLLSKDKKEIKSAGLQDINRKIQKHLSERDKSNIINIQMKLEEDNNKEALLCDFDYFKFLFNTQKRKRTSEKEHDYLTLISLEDDLSKEELKEWGISISKVLKGLLRWGDAFTFWNELQILILLQNVQGDGIASIENRIKENLQAESIDIKYDIKIKSSSIMSETAMLQEIQ